MNQAHDRMIRLAFQDEPLQGLSLRCAGWEAFRLSGLHPSLRCDGRIANLETASFRRVSEDVVLMECVFAGGLRLSL